MSEPINSKFFDAAFTSKLSDTNFKPITDERELEILNEEIKFHEEVYLPAEKAMEAKLGRPLTTLEMMTLTMELRWGI